MRHSSGLLLVSPLLASGSEGIATRRWWLCAGDGFNLQTDSVRYRKGSRISPSSKDKAECFGHRNLGGKVCDKSTPTGRAGLTSAPQVVAIHGSLGWSSGLWLASIKRLELEGTVNCGVLLCSNSGAGPAVNPTFRAQHGTPTDGTPLRDEHVEPGSPGRRSLAR